MFYASARDKQACVFAKYVWVEHTLSIIASQPRSRESWANRHAKFLTSLTSAGISGHLEISQYIE
jgi:hypothetical protein